MMFCFFSSRRRHTRCALVTGVQTCALPISVEPRFLVADEPVSMLDVSIRAGILNLLRKFAAELGMGILYISHDLSTMRHICSRVAIMYLGRIVEIGPADSMLKIGRAHV